MSHYNPPRRTPEEAAAAAAAYEASRAAEQAALKAQREVYQDIALEIALCLNCSWEGSGDEEHHNRYLSDWTIGRQELKTAAGHGITLRFNDHGAKNRVKVWGTYGQYANGQPIRTDTEQITITASLKKSPEQIARDIENRFMPQFLKAIAEADERRAADDQAILWAASKAQFMISHFGYWIESKTQDFDPYQMKNPSFRLHAQNLPSLEVMGSHKRLTSGHGAYIKTEAQLFEILELLARKRLGKGSKAYRRSPRHPWQRRQRPAASTGRSGDTSAVYVLPLVG